MTEKVRKKQCKACPWKKSVSPDDDIPGGYCRTKHANLKNTIAEPGSVTSLGDSTMRVMACHESDVGNDIPCVGWLVNQLGPGNNIALRMRALDGRYNGLQTEGPQCETFEQTLKKRKSRKASK